jgi:hypothetical protein
MAAPLLQNKDLPPNPLAPLNLNPIELNAIRDDSNHLFLNLKKKTPNKHPKG